jgi:imidazole glycerol-phosphate synthase subunit HisH
MIIVNSGLGNVASIYNMLNQIGLKPKISENYDEISESQNIILPGVGSFKKGIQILKEKKIDLAIINAAQNNAKILGICLGMHFLFEESEEGDEKGLGFIKGKVIKFNFEKYENKVPHMGWNYVNFCKNSKLNFEYNEKIKFYFAHSYYVNCEQKEDIAATTKYGFNFVSAIQKKNLYGVQFHPEKSHNFGKIFFRNLFDKNK